MDRRSRSKSPVLRPPGYVSNPKFVLPPEIKKKRDTSALSRLKKDSSPARH